MPLLYVAVMLFSPLCILSIPNRVCISCILFFCEKNLISSLSLLPTNESSHFYSNSRSKFRSFALSLNAQTSSLTRDGDGAERGLDRAPSMILPPFLMHFHLMVCEPQEQHPGSNQSPNSLQQGN
jgi:hypothetical protein